MARLTHAEWFAVIGKCRKERSRGYSIHRAVLNGSLQPAAITAEVISALKREEVKTNA